MEWLKSHGISLLVFLGAIMVGWYDIQQEQAKLNAEINLRLDLYEKGLGTIKTDIKENQLLIPRVAKLETTLNDLTPSIQELNNSVTRLNITLARDSVVRETLVNDVKELKVESKKLWEYIYSYPKSDVINNQSPS